MITFQTYEYWPNLKRLKKESSNHYDFIAIGLQATIDTETEKKDYLTFVAYIVVDKYNDNINLTFDFATESDGRTIHWSIHRGKEKKPGARKIKIANGYDEVTLKPVQQLDFKAKNLHDFMQDYFYKILDERIIAIEEYAKTNDMSLDEDQLNAWCNDIYENFCDIEQETFIEPIISESYPLTSIEFIQKINTHLAYEYLNEKVHNQSQKSIKRQKI